MKTIYALLFGLTLLLTAYTVQAQVVTRKVPRHYYYYPVAVKNSTYRVFFAAPHGYYYDNLARLVPIGFHYNGYGRLVVNRAAVVVEPTVNFGGWGYVPAWRTENPWWR